MTFQYRNPHLALDAASATRTGQDSFEINDDRVQVDLARLLFVVADGAGPTYGGYHAPIGMDLAIDILSRGLDDAGNTQPLVDGASCLRAAFTAAHASCATLEDELRAAFEVKLRTYGEDRLGASLAASREVAARCGRPVESFAHFAASITALHIWGGDRITIAQVGLCRGYRFRHGNLEQLLPDHSLASALIAKGETLAPDAPARLCHVPLRLLGMAQGAVPDMRTEHVEPADRYLLCTDGVWACLEPEEIRDALSIGAKPAVIAAALVDRVAQRPRPRPHATAVVIDVAGLPSN